MNAAMQRAVSGPLQAPAAIASRPLLRGTPCGKRGSSRRRPQHWCTAQQRPQQQPKAKKERAKLPDSGYFAEADPKAEVYSPLAGVSNPDSDFTKRSSGRYASDFIWNTNWQEQLRYQENLQKIKERAAQKAASGERDGPDVGAVSFSRKALLDSMDVDLSAQLRPRKKPATEQASTSGRGQQQQQQRRRPKQGSAAPTRPATQAEARRWARGGKFARRVVAVSVNEAEDAERAAQVEAERERYNQLKQELLLWTLASGVGIFAITWAFYTRDVALSYAVGAAGGLFYLRLLNRSVEGFGGGAVGAVVGQQRLLIPIILALGFNRWNTLAAEEYGVQLQLLPMLLGFFTYKGAVVAKSSLALFEELTASLKSGEAAINTSGSEAFQQLQAFQEQQEQAREAGAGSAPMAPNPEALQDQEQQPVGAGRSSAGAVQGGLTPEDRKRLDREYRQKMLTRI